MKTKAAISLLTLLFMLAAAAAVVAEDAKKDSVDQRQVKSESARVDSTEITEPEAQVIVYYFHGTRRCPSCKKIEAYTKETIETAYADQLKAGSIVWRPINTDNEGNGHFTQDYQLYTKSVILSDVKDGKEIKWKNLDRVWKLLGDKESFSEYVQGEVDAFVGED